VASKALSFDSAIREADDELGFLLVRTSQLLDGHCDLIDVQAVAEEGLNYFASAQADNLVEYLVHFREQDSLDFLAIDLTGKLMTENLLKFAHDRKSDSSFGEIVPGYSQNLGRDNLN